MTTIQQAHRPQGGRHRNPKRRRRIGRALAASAIACGALASCSGSSSGTASDADQLEVAEATIDWPANPKVAAVRLTITNDTDTDDTLTGVTTSTGDASLHRSGTDDQGRSTMTQLDRLAVPAGETVTFEAGDLHVMVENPDPPLEVGDRVGVTLVFERAGNRTVQAEVIEPGSADDATEMGDHDG